MDTLPLTPTARRLQGVLQTLDPSRSPEALVEAALAALLSAETPGQTPQAAWVQRVAALHPGAAGPFTLDALLGDLGELVNAATRRMAGHALKALGYTKRQRVIEGVRAIYWERPASAAG